MPSIVDIRAALETAILSIANIIPSVVITSSTNGVFLTASPHNLVTDLDITISSHSILNGSYFAVRVDATHFSLKDKVTGSAITSVASGTGGAVAANLIAWDNMGFKPIAGVPYQKVNIVFAEPENPSYSGPATAGQKLRRELGFLQITLYYPVQKGTKLIATRAELFRTLFPRGASFESNGQVVNIPRDASIITTGPLDESFTMIVKIPFWADVFY